MLRTITPRRPSRTAAVIRQPLVEAAAALRAASHIVVVSHEGPDGDALGATLGAALGLEALGARVTRFNNDPAPYNLAFLPGADRIVHELPPGEHVDVTVLLDCASRARAGAAFPAHGWGDVVICLDHHVTFDPDVADILIRDVEAAATGELVYRLLVECGVPVTPDIATALYCSIQTDTGSFRYGCTSSDCMEIASELLRTGIDVWDMSSRIYEDELPERLGLLSRVLDTLDVSACGRMATIVITQEAMRETGADASMTDGFVNYARSVRGVEVAAQLLEVGDGTYRIGFRSRGSVDVARVAQQLGGGGHQNAAGCTVSGDPASVRAALDAALRQALDG